MPVTSRPNGVYIRLSVDLNQGSHQMLKEALRNHNASLPRREHELRTSGLARSLLGSWAKGRL